MVLMSVALPMGQDHGRIEIAFEGLEAVLDIGTLKRKIPVTKAQDFDLFLGNISQEGGGTVPRLGFASAGGAEDDPSYDEIGHRASEAQNRSAATDLNVVGVSTQAKQPQRSLPLRWENEGQQAHSPKSPTVLGLTW